MGKINKRMFGPGGIKVNTLSGKGHVVKQLSTRRFLISDSDGLISPLMMGSNVDESQFTITVKDSNSNEITVSKLSGRTLMSTDGERFSYSFGDPANVDGSVSFDFLEEEEEEPEPEPEPEPEDDSDPVDPFYGLNVPIFQVMPDQPHIYTAVAYYEYGTDFSIDLPAPFGESEIVINQSTNSHLFTVDGNQITISDYSEGGTVEPKVYIIGLTSGDYSMYISWEPKRAVGYMSLAAKRSDPIVYPISYYYKVSGIPTHSFTDNGITEENDWNGFYQTHPHIPLDDPEYPEYPEYPEDRNRAVVKKVGSKAGHFMLLIEGESLAEEWDLSSAYIMHLTIK